MRYEIESCEEGLRVFSPALREPIAIFPTLRDDNYEDTMRRAERYVAHLLVRDSGHN